jgi:hypothetical protein
MGGKVDSVKYVNDTTVKEAIQKYLEEVLADTLF